MTKSKIKEILIANNKYQVIINRKAIKNTYIRIDEKINIVVNTNKYTPYKQIETLIFKNQDKLVKIVNNKKEQMLPKNKIAYLGEYFEMVFKKKSGFNYDIINDKIVFYTNLNKEEALNLFYKIEAESYLPKRLQICHTNFIKYIRISLPELSVRKMNCRYGTCYYTKNKINLNSYIMKYNDEQIDYVIYHELCHFIHHNHGKKFYELLSTIIPNHKNIRKNLN